MTRRSIVYLGWQGHGNFGDDLLHETWKLALDDRLDVEAPLNGAGYKQRAAQFLRDRLRLVGAERIALLGGGTTIGFRSWADHAALAARCFGTSAVVGTGLGAAAASDTFATAHQPQDWDAWRRVPGFRLLGVRGPSTAAEVTANLEPTRVVGDPALLYPLLRPVVPVEGPVRIGVALGSDPTTRFDIRAVARAVERHAASRGISHVVAFALSAADRAVARELASLLSLETRVHHYEPDHVHRTMRELAGCSAVVSERLHGAIPAVAMGVPTVALSYASKCDDFWESVTDHAAPIGIGSSTDAITQALAAADTAVSPARVVALQRELETVAAALRSWRTGSTPLDRLSILTAEESLA